MKFETGCVYHIYNQGNNKQEIFTSPEDYKRFLELAKSFIVPQADILAWCLLPNHFHFMIHANEKSAQPYRQGGNQIDLLTNGFRKLLSSYSHEFNKRCGRSGSLFRPKTRAKNLSAFQTRNPTGFNDYCLNCFYYIHQNPLSHRLVKDPREWKYSSFRFYSGERERDICDKQLARKICDYNETTFLDLVYNRIPDEFLSVFEDEK